MLPPAVADQIAAGEVIERPASIVKELIENACDAGATEIEVFLREGGLGEIIVTDNGTGMSPTDLALSVQKHATSKIETFDDLERLTTLGFRGEALPSIVAVSRLAIVTRAAPRSASTAFQWSAGNVEAITHGHFLSSPHGTRVVVSDLFANVPARLKFLKTARGETAAVRETLERLALVKPSIGFVFHSDDREIFRFRPESEAERVRRVLADGQDFPIHEEQSEGLRSFWVRGLSLGNSKSVLMSLNGRPIRDRLIHQAVVQAFRQTFLPGQYPAIFLRLEMDPTDFDVNAHPTKLEVRFRESSKVFRMVASHLERVIATQGQSAWVSGPSHAAGTSSWTAREAPLEFTAAPLPMFSNTRPQDLPNPETQPERTVPPLLPRDLPVIGTIFQTYILIDQGSELLVIDQHAAHERIRYEQLKASFLKQAPQAQEALLLPETLRFVHELDPVTLETRLHWIRKLGFEVESFGPESFIFRALPQGFGSFDLRTRLSGLLDRALAHMTFTGATDSQTLLDEQIFERLASEACHGSVRAGDRLERSEADALIADLFKTEHPWNCPHGRPTTTRIPRARFEEWFQRSL